MARQRGEVGLEGPRVCQTYRYVWFRGSLEVSWFDASYARSRVGPAPLGDHLSRDGVGKERPGLH
eukprot:9339665-Pyramimonas_sp.AAC.1